MADTHGPSMLAMLIGDQRQGKTLACRLLAEQARAAGFSIGGIIQPAVYEADVCIGYDIVDLAVGHRVHLAVIGGGGVERVGRFEFLADGLALGKAAIRQAAQEHPRLLIIDEVGPLELAGGGWSEQLDELVQRHADRPAVPPRKDVGAAESGRQPGRLASQLMLCSVRRSLLAEVRARWGSAQDSAGRRQTARVYDMSDGLGAIIGDIIMSLHRE
ncbi:MAG TPA: nucleoside-triphosphatase [Phycisphaerae bacterium]|nr:nucleoside-triphosphatase [Phycisphaerae bacterium]